MEIRTPKVPDLSKIDEMQEQYTNTANKYSNYADMYSTSGMGADEFSWDPTDGLPLNIVSTSPISGPKPYSPNEQGDSNTSASDKPIDSGKEMEGEASEGDYAKYIGSMVSDNGKYHNILKRVLRPDKGDSMMMGGFLTYWQEKEYSYTLQNGTEEKNQENLRHTITIQGQSTSNLCTGKTRTTLLNVS